MRIAIAATMILLSAYSPLWAGGISGAVRARGVRHSGNVVVYVARIPGVTFAPPEQPVVVDQERLTFVPHVVPVLVGTTVEFHNSDEVLHNVFSPDYCVDNMTLGTWPKGETKSHVFDTQCSAVLLCNVHPEMEAFVIAVGTPYFAVTDVDGSYTIADVPEGTYVVKIWHERLDGDSVEVTVPADGVATLNFDISRVKARK